MPGASNNNEKVVPIREKDPFYRELLQEEGFGQYLKGRIKEKRGRKMLRFWKRGESPDIEALQEVIHITERWSERSEGAMEPLPSEGVEKEPPTLITPGRPARRLLVKALFVPFLFLAVVAAILLLSPPRVDRDVTERGEMTPEEGVAIPLPEGAGPSDGGEVRQKEGERVEGLPLSVQGKGEPMIRLSLKREIFVRRGDSLSSISSILNFPHRPPSWKGLAPDELERVEETMRRLLELNRGYLTRLNRGADPDDPYSFNTILTGDFLTISREER